MTNKALIILSIILFLIACQKKSEFPFLAYQKISESTMLSANNEAIFVDALPDTILTQKSDYIKVEGGIYTNSSDVQIIDKGHIYKAVNANSSDTLPTFENGGTSFSSGKGTGEFTSDIRNLAAETDYYIRSYATIRYEDGRELTGYNPVVLHVKTPKEQNRWEIVKSNYPGKPRIDGVKFIIENKAYVGLGFDGAFALKDIWSFDYNTLSWSAIAVFPGKSRYGAVAFVLDGIGYVALGVDNDGNYLKDCWAYDPKIGTDGKWYQVSNFPGIGRKNALAFVLNDADGKPKAYIATGVNGSNYLIDVWKYNPEYDSWLNNETDLNNIQIREKAIGFTIGNYAYIGFGKRNNEELKDFYKIDPQYFTWQTVSPDFPGKARHGAVAFSGIEGFYIGGGESDTLYLNDFWYYDPYNNKWVEKTSITDTTRIEGGVANGVGFFLGEYGFIGLGQTKEKKINYFWQYIP